MALHYNQVKISSKKSHDNRPILRCGVLPVPTTNCSVRDNVYDYKLQCVLYIFLDMETVFKCRCCPPISSHTINRRYVGKTAAGLRPTCPNVYQLNLIIFLTVMWPHLCEINRHPHSVKNQWLPIHKGMKGPLVFATLIVAVLCAQERFDGWVMENAFYSVTK